MFVFCLFVCIINYDAYLGNAVCIFHWEREVLLEAILPSSRLRCSREILASLFYFILFCFVLFCLFVWLVGRLGKCFCVVAYENSYSDRSFCVVVCWVVLWMSELE